MIKAYFLLQFHLLKRQLIDFGIHLIVSIVLLPAVFVGASLLLFSKTEHAGSIYVLIALSFCTSLSEKKRNDFLKFNFSKSNYRRIRYIENFILVAPFILILVIKSEFLHCIVLFVLSVASANIHIRRKDSLVIPTPFSRRPFEFAVGFRYTYILLLLDYFFALMSVLSGNFNLGAFALMVVFLLSLTYYLKPENDYFVWSFSIKSPRFIFAKIKIAVLHSSILSAPVFLMLAISFEQSLQTLLVVQLLGYASIVVIILAKYAAYPNQINLPQYVILALGLYLPPALLLIIPFLYIQAVKRLNEILE